MKAALYMGQKQIEMTELPDPVCGEDDIVLKNIYASICGTDVAVYMHGPNTRWQWEENMDIISQSHDDSATFPNETEIQIWLLEESSRWTYQSIRQLDQIPRRGRDKHKGLLDIAT